MSKDDCELCFDSRTMENFGLKVLNPDFELEEDGEGITHFNVEVPHTMTRILEWTKEIVETWASNGQKQ